MAATRRHGIICPVNECEPQAKHCLLYTSIQEPTSFAQVFPAFWREVELPVYLENDANLACEGEAFLRRGAGGAANMLYLSIGSGLSLIHIFPLWADTDA